MLAKYNQKVQRELKNLKPEDLSEEHLGFIAEITKFGLKLVQIAELFDWDYDAKGYFQSPVLLKAFKRECVQGILHVDMKAYQKATNEEGDSDMIKFWLRNMRNIGKWGEIYVHETQPSGIGNKNFT